MTALAEEAPMKVRTINRIAYVGMAILLVGFAVQVIAGLLERPLSLWTFLSHLLPTAAFLGLTPFWFKTIRDREATYGPDGTMPASYSRRLGIVLAVALVAMVLGIALAFSAGYSHAH
jgi:hypothetical protein